MSEEKQEKKVKREVERNRKSTLPAENSKLKEFSRVNTIVWKANDALSSEAVSNIIGNDLFKPIKEGSKIYTFDSQKAQELQEDELKEIADNLEAALKDYQDEPIS